MAETKRIMISLPHNLLEEVDGIVADEKRTRSDFIREAMRLYLAEREKLLIRERMQRGYAEMAKLNLLLATEAFEVENEANLIAELLVGNK
ncbi:MAG: ribbon-helix-helix protein, CopG family [Dethiobacter sp.]|nr:ribbon-helix-helix protein, CopG family [Dethiobacter sp.]MBS3897621.1 ribbon-helix-helix protein, CopG family [Dethiobacter sp.]MBS3983413.1 ribbon-helix-helix protein, CopG family [Dethiobacter sp.]